MITFDRDETTLEEEERVALTGSRRAGKSYVAEHGGYEAYGVADPMYRLSEHYLGTSDKSEDGVRAFLQSIGALGRGEDPDGECPVGRVSWDSIKEDIRKYGSEITPYDTNLWARFGRQPSFWVKMLSARVGRADGRIAVPNARFPNEISTLMEEHGFAHYHVMCHPTTRRVRLSQSGEDPDGDAEEDVTERLAQELNEIARTGDVKSALDGSMMCSDLGPRLLRKVAKRETVIWSDPHLTPDFDRTASQVYT